MNYPLTFAPVRYAILAVMVIGLAIGAVCRASASGQPSPPHDRSHEAAPDSNTDGAAHGLREADGSWKYTNRLVYETSPYLLLHAHNPVDWYPWGTEAIERARREGKPIFLSVGYTTCYWCHVMERLVFSDPAIAEQMNHNFVNIKVDREERPDVDEIYMTATRIITGHGGWPNSVFLTPELNPFFAGTYFPPKDDPRYNRPGFPRVIEVIRNAWANRRSDVVAQSRYISSALGRIHLVTPPEKSDIALGYSTLDRAIGKLKLSYDPVHGGFGDAPKFPPDQALDLLMSQHQRRNESELLDIVTGTLDKMAAGGIFDHLGGGFHRYAIDPGWQVPHFEKMLYNQAQLTRIYLRAYQMTGNQHYRYNAEDILRYVSREMTSPEGAFYSALDSETNGKEGEYYLWTRAEIRRILKEDADLFLKVYDLARMPEGDGMVLYLPKTLDALADTLSLSAAGLRDRLRPLKRKLLSARELRVRPLLDDKIITAWNGLMIAAYADAYALLKSASYLRAARRAANFVLGRMRDGNGDLIRIYRNGTAKNLGFQEDYAFLIQGLVSLYEASGEPRYLREAEALTERMRSLYWDVDGGGFFFTSGAEHLITRTKKPYDGAIPSGNSVAVNALLSLHKLTKKAEYMDLASRSLHTFGALLQQSQGGFNNMYHGLLRYLEMNSSKLTPIVHDTAVSGARASTDSIIAASHEAVEASAIVRTTPPVAGGRLELLVRLKVKKGWHINANPASLDFLVPTTLSISSEHPLEAIDISYPTAKSVRFPFADQPLAVYEGEVTIPAIFEIRRYPPGALRLDLVLDFQACDDTRCLPPSSITLSVDVVPSDNRG